MPTLVNLKVSELRKRGYNNVSMWLSDPKHLYIGRRMRIFIHTKQKCSEPSGTRVTRDQNDTKILKRPHPLKDVPFDDTLLSFPVGSYVDKRNEIIHLCIIPKSKWYNPFKVKAANRTQITDEYQEYLKNNTSLLKDIHELDNYKEIGCWCKPKQCHGDHILEFYNKLKTGHKSHNNNNIQKQSVANTNSRKIENKSISAKKPKDPNKPKQSQSSYFLFYNDIRSSFKQKFPNKKPTEIAKLVGLKWKKMTVDEKKQYEEKATLLRDEYKTELMEYQKTKHYKEYQQKLCEWKQEQKSQKEKSTKQCD